MIKMLYIVQNKTIGRGMPDSKPYIIPMVFVFLVL